MLTGEVVSVTRRGSQVHGLPDIGERRCNAGNENENMLRTLGLSEHVTVPACRFLLM